MRIKGLSRRLGVLHHYLSKIIFVSTSVVLLVLVSFFRTFSQTEEPVIYQFKGDFPPIRLTFSELEKFLDDLEHLYTAFDDSAKTAHTCTYELKGPTGSVSAASIQKVFNEGRLSYATGFTLSCFNRHLRVSSMNLTLTNNPTWEIHGSDRVLLDSIRSQLDRFGETYRTYLGGLFPQIALYLVIWLASFVALPIIATKLLGRERRMQLDNLLFIFALVLSFLMAFLVFSYGLLEWLFPTVAIYKGTASFIERYSAEISFWGVIISLLFTIWFGRSTKTSKG